MNDEDKQQYYDLAEKLYSEENFAAALITGAVATVLAAAAYGITVSQWAFTYGFAAAGIGILIGLSMRYLGRGISRKFAVAAVAYTTIGFLLGNLFRVVVEMAQGTATSPVDVLSSHSLSDIAQQSVSCYSLIDIVYWFVAAYCAAFLVHRSLTRSERLAVGLFKLKASSANDQAPSN